MFNQDDDEYQLQEEFDNIESDSQKNNAFGGEEFNFGDVNGNNEPTAEPTSTDFGRSGDEDSGTSQE
jgi:hypothetical protein